MKKKCKRIRFSAKSYGNNKNQAKDKTWENDKKIKTL